MKPPENAEIEVRGQKFVVKALTIEEEGKVLALRNRLAEDRWADLAESKSKDDTTWALLFQAAAELSYAIVQAPKDFPGPTKLSDMDFLWEIYDAYQETMVRPFRAQRVAEAEEKPEQPGKE